MREQINPSYSNQILLIGEPTFRVNNSEIISDNKTRYLHLEFEPNVYNDSVNVKSVITYIEKADEGEIEVPVIKVVSKYDIIKTHDLTAKELYPIVEKSWHLLNHYFLNASPPLASRHKIPDFPQFEEMLLHLEDLAKNLNQ